MLGLRRTFLDSHVTLEANRIILANDATFTVEEEDLDVIGVAKGKYPHVQYWYSTISAQSV